MNRLEKEFQIEELKRYGFQILKSAIGLYCAYTIIMAEEAYSAYYPPLITFLTILLFFILPFTLIRGIYKFFKTLCSPTSLRR